MFYSHQLLARKAPLGQIWMAATLHAKINRKKLNKLDIIQICEEILNPSVPMALRLSGILMGGVVIVYERKVKLLFDDVTRLLVEINGAWRTKAAPDPTLLPKGRTHARKEAVTLPEKDEADFGDFEQTRSQLPKFPNFMDFQQSYISMRLDEPNVNDIPEQEDLGQHFHQADAENITLFEYHASYQTNTETYDRFERFDIEGDDETQLNFNPGEGAQIPPILIPSPPRHHDFPEGGNPTSPQRQEQQEHGTDVFAEQMGEQNIPDREDQDIPRPTKRRTRRTATSAMDNEQTIITGPQFQSWLQDTSHILLRGKKRKARGPASPSIEVTKRMKLPLTQLFEGPVDGSYPPQLMELWLKCTQPLQTSTSETGRPDVSAEQSPGFVQERMENHHQTDHHQGTETSFQSLGSPAERLRNALAEKDGSIEGLMAKSRASAENNNRQAADISVTPLYSGDDVRSMPSSTPSARGAASVNVEINSNSRRLNRKRQHSSPRRGLEPVAEDRTWEHRAYDFEFSMLPEKGFTADNEVLVETGPTQTQKPVTTRTDEKITDSIKSHLKTHFETPGAAQVESLNKLAIGMKRNGAAQLFYQSCVLATRGVIKVEQTQPYGDILIARGPNM